MARKNESLLKVKSTPGCCGFVRAETAAPWGGEYRFEFVANFSAGNEVGIGEKICAGYKGTYAGNSGAMTVLETKNQEGV